MERESEKKARLKVKKKLQKYKQFRPEWLWRNVREGGREPWSGGEEVRTVFLHSAPCCSGWRGLSRLHMDGFTKALVMKHHLLHSSGDLLNPHNALFFLFFFISWNDVIHFLFPLGLDPFCWPGLSGYI